VSAIQFNSAARLCIINISFLNQEQTAPHGFRHGARCANPLALRGTRTSRNQGYMSRFEEAAESAVARE